MAPHTTVSIATQCSRFSLGIRLCNVTPEEYRSRVLIAKSCAIAKIRNGTTNHDWNPATKPVGESAAAGTAVPIAAPRISSNADGIAAPNVTASTMLLPLVDEGKYRE